MSIVNVSSLGKSQAEHKNCIPYEFPATIGTAHNTASDASAFGKLRGSIRVDPQREHLVLSNKSSSKTLPQSLHTYSFMFLSSQFRPCRIRYMKRRATFSIYIRPAIQPTAFHLFLLQRP
jgi:hypothetical protein